MQDVNKLTRAEQKARRPGQILDAAFEEFVAQGYAATRIEDVAERVGVTKGTIYVYFATKEDLFSAMIRHISVPFAEVVSSADDLAASCTDRLRSLIELFYRRVLRDRKARELLRFIVAEGPRFPHVIDQHHVEFIEPFLARTQLVIDEGVRQGEFRAAAAALADVVMAPALLMMIFRLIFDDRKTMDEAVLLQAHLDLVLNGLKV